MNLKNNSTILLISIVLIQFLVFDKQTIATPKSTGPMAEFRLNGNGINASGAGKAVIKNGKTTEGHEGNAGSAVAFTFDNKTHSKYIRNITFPVDINPAKCPQLTMTFWVKATNSNFPMFLLGNGTDPYTRGVIIRNEDSQYRLGANCGEDGMLWGPPLVEGWNFIAVLYDYKNQEVRMVVNDLVYSSRGTTRSGEEKAFVGALNGAIDDIRFYDRLLTQAEIEEISGKSITRNGERLTIKDKYSYRDRMKLEKKNKLKINGKYIVDSENFLVTDTAKMPNTKATLQKGDTLVVLDKPSDNWYRIGYQNGKNGFARRSAIVNNAYPEGTSVLLFRLSNWFSHIFNFTKLSSWIAVLVCAVLLFLVKRYFVQLDHFLLHLRPSRDEYEDGGSKSGTSRLKSKNLLLKIYPIRSYPWYPLLTGILLGATLFIGSFWDTYEMEWYFNEGINLLPIGYDRPVHWFLYAMTLIIFFLTLSWIIESFVLGGPFIGLVRIIILLVINFMSLLVSFFLLLLITLFILVMIGLWVFGNTVGSGSYKCPSCGRTFSAGAGSSVSCPGCGARLST